jgi:hypothetical protein
MILTSESSVAADGLEPISENKINIDSGFEYICFSPNME